MPMPIAALHSVQIFLANLPNDLPAHEQHRLLALTLINHLGSLGRVLSFVSTAKIQTQSNFQFASSDALLAELDAGLFTLGELQTCLADAAYSAVEEMFSLLNEPPAEPEEVSHA